MTGHLKSIEQRANQVYQKLMDWRSRNPKATDEHERRIFTALLYEAISNAEAALHKRMVSKRPTVPLPARFPFRNHRTLKAKKRD